MKQGIIRRIFEPVDLTTGTPWKRILHFAIPILLSSILNNALSLINSIILKYTVGGDSVTAMNSTGSISAILLNFAYGCASGFAIIMANRKGAKDEEGQRKTFTTGILLAFILAILITTIGLFTYQPLLGFLNIAPQYLEKAGEYYQIILIGFLITLMSNLLSNYLVSLGSSSMSLLFGVSTTVLHIGFVYLFTGVLHLDTRGAAIAMLLTNLTNLSLHYFYLRYKFPFLKRKKKEKAFDKGIALQCLKMGLPLGFQWSILFIGSFYQARRVNQFGDGLATKAGACYGSYEGYLTIPFSVMSSALLNYVGQNFGAKEKDRIFKGIRAAFLIDLLAYGLVLIIGLSTAKSVPYLFLPSEEVNERIIYYTSTYIRDISLFMILQGLVTLSRSVLQGLKLPLIPFLSGIGELAARILICMFIPGLVNPSDPLSDVSYQGICFSTPLAWAVSVLIMGGSVIYIVYIKKLAIVDKEKEEPLHKELTNKLKK